MPNFASFPQSEPSTPPFPSELLRVMYASFYSLSAHLHFMRADWRRGRSCPGRGTHHDIVSGVERYGLMQHILVAVRYLLFVRHL